MIEPTRDDIYTMEYNEYDLSVKEEMLKRILANKMTISEVSNKYGLNPKAINRMIK